MVSLKRMNCEDPGKGPWHAVVDIPNRMVVVRHRKSGRRHPVYYGTRTERTLEGAQVQATALCAVLNALKAKTL